MQRKNIQKIRAFKSFIFCTMLVVSMMLFTTGCGNKTDNGAASDTETEIDIQADDSSRSDSNVLGTGDTEFTLTVVDKDGNEEQFEVHTDKETVGDALQELGMIEGEESEYGLYVKTVNGITADYDTDGVYWAFYINDEYASSGVDSTEITEGESYSFRVE